METVIGYQKYLETIVYWYFFGHSVSSHAISDDLDIKPIPIKGLLEEMSLEVRDSLSCYQYSILTVASTQRYSVQLITFKWSALKQTCRLF